jgi:hypothetical protein
VNATVVIWAVFLKAVHFKPILRPAGRENLKNLSVKACGLVGVMVLWFVVKESRSGGLVIDMEMMAMSMRAMLHGKNDVSEVVVVRGDGVSFGNGGVEMVVVDNT